MILFVTPASEPALFTAPLFTERCPAGFPSPAADYTEDELDLNAYCIRRPSATYFVRAIGDSMKEIGLHSGDLMVVDKAEKSMQGDIDLEPFVTHTIFAVFKSTDMLSFCKKYTYGNIFIYHMFILRLNISNE